MVAGFLLAGFLLAGFLLGGIAFASCLDGPDARLLAGDLIA